MEQYFYPVILQHSSEADFDDVTYFQELLHLIKEHLIAKDTESQKAVGETVLKNGASLRGGLGQFLSTPLKSDKDEIDRLIKENFENLLRQLGCTPSFNTTKTDVYRVIDQQNVPLHRQLVGVMRRLLKNGKIVLTDAGVNTGKGSGSIYCFTANAEGFSTINLLKEEVENCIALKPEVPFTLVNESILSVLHSVSGDPIKDTHVVVMNFTSTKEALDRIRTRMKVMTTQFGVKESKLLKRSFSTGFTTPYQLQFSVDIEKHALGSIIMSLVDDDAEIEDALTMQGSLIVLEKIA
jgi:hypothetical protein